MATSINSRSQNSSCSLGAAIDNESGLRIQADLSWNFNSSAPSRISAYASYNNSSQGFSINRSYSPDGTWSPEEEIPCTVFDDTFDNALKALVLACFENYNNVQLINVEG